MLVTPEQVKRAIDYKYEDVPVPEWDNRPEKEQKADPLVVRIRSAGGHGHDRIRYAYNEARALHPGIEPDLLYIPRELVISECAIHADGTRMFTSQADVLMLGDKSPEVLDRLYWTAMRLSGFTKEAEEEIEKN